MHTILRAGLVGTAALLLCVGVLAAGGCGGGGGGTPAANDPGGGDPGGNDPGPSTNADLQGLAVSAGTLAPAFDPAVSTYAVGPGLMPCSVTCTPTAADDGATLTVNGEAVTSGAACTAIDLPVGATPVLIVVTAEDGSSQRTYNVVFTREAPSAQDGYFKAPNAEAGDQLGISVALSGDTLVVGARTEDSAATGVDGDDSDNSASSSGAAYVFVRDGTGWAEQAYLKASNTGAGDTFGYSVAVSGDTVVVGANYEDSAATGVDGDGSDDSAPDSGAAYVFVRSGTTWTQQAYLKASNTGAGDYFGTSVAIDGETIVVGARREASGVAGDSSDNSAPQAGAAYVFVRNGTTWTQQAYLKASDPDATDWFGEVSISGDTIVVGSWLEDSAATGIDGDELNDAATDSGAAYVFVRNGTSWTQEAYLKASNTDAFDQFGRCVCVCGDTIVVGSYLEDSGATGVDGDESDNGGAWDSGAAYVYVRSGTTWTQQAYLKASNTGDLDWFGWGVAVAGDTLVVGAHQEDSAATGIGGNQGDDTADDAGAAYVFLRTDSTWTQEAYVKAPATDPSDRFGYFVAVSGDAIALTALSEDSSATGVGGDPSDNGAENSGAAYVYR